MDDSADSLGYISLATENLGLRTHKLSPAVVGEDKDTREVGREGEGGQGEGFRRKHPLHKSLFAMSYIEVSAQG